VPCYRHASFLPAAVASILAQTRRPDEVIFVDDRSPDATGEVLSSLVVAHPELAGRVSVIENDVNSGQAASLNRGIAAAYSDVIMILNDDDYLMHDAIVSMLGFFAEYPEAALIGAHCIYFSSEDQLAAMPKLSTAYARGGTTLDLRRPKDVRRYRRYNDLNMTHSGSCFFKVVWQEIGGYSADKSLRVVPFSDRDFQLRVNCLWPVAVSSVTPFTLWRQGSSVDAGVNS
jgi:glycosyltransferase involved in cell wall biosynthesis